MLREYDVLLYRFHTDSIVTIRVSARTARQAGKKALRLLPGWSVEVVAEASLFGGSVV